MEANRPDAVLIQSRSPLFQIITKEQEPEDKESSEIKSLADKRNLEGRSLKGATRG